MGRKIGGLWGRGRGKGEGGRGKRCEEAHTTHPSDLYIIPLARYVEFPDNNISKILDTVEEFESLQLKRAE